MGKRSFYPRGSLRNPYQLLRLLVNLPKLFRLFGRLFQDPRVPLHLKLIPLGALVYAILPFDLVPDFLVPLIGYVDDLIVLFWSFNYFLRKCPQEVVWEHLRAIEGGV